MNKAAFSLEKYKFEKIDLDLSRIESDNLEVAFSPTGKFIESDSSFELSFVFKAHNGDENKSFIEIKCLAIFQFEENLTFEEIPPYFYINSIAILFPYIRSFVSTVTLQANIPPIVLPTMNLSNLGEPLKNSTVKC